MIIRRIEHKNSKIGIRVAVASDLHGTDFNEPVSLLKSESPDIIVCPGDIFEMRDGLSKEKKELINRNGFSFLSAASKIAPTFFSRGNHDAFPTDFEYGEIERTGAVILDGSMQEEKGILIGGLGSGGSNRYFKSTNSPDNAEFLKDFANNHGFKLLLCHHPEYYDEYIKPLPIDLTVCGHAHGGQWVIFGRSIFAPGQGLFPKYVSGEYDGGRLVVSRGMGGLTWIPRIANPCEIVIISL